MVRFFAPAKDMLAMMFDLVRYSIKLTEPKKCNEGQNRFVETVPCFVEVTLPVSA